MLDGPLLSMRWRDCLFAHWPVAPSVVDAHLPASLSVDTHDGEAWLGVVAFVMEDVRPRGFPVGLSFPELNLRTYVRHDGEEGVYFFNLDAADSLSVAVARTLFSLPYYRARMDVERRDGEVRFRSRRAHPRTPPVRFEGTYRPTGPGWTAEPGSLASFLLENYRFYAAGRGLFRGRIDHEPWTVHDAALEVETNDLFAASGFDCPAGEPTVHVADPVAVTAGRIRRADPLSGDEGGEGD